MDELLQIFQGGIESALQISVIVFLLVQLLKGAGWSKIMPGETTDVRASRLTLVTSMILSFLVEAKKASFDVITFDFLVDFIFAGFVGGLLASVFYRQVAKRFASLFYAEETLKGSQDAEISG